MVYLHKTSGRLPLTKQCLGLVVFIKNCSWLQQNNTGGTRLKIGDAGLNFRPSNLFS